MLLGAAAMYYSLITSLLTVFSKAKDCIYTASGPSKEIDDEPDEQEGLSPEEQVKEEKEKRHLALSASNP